MGPMLLAHMQPASAGKYGVQIHGEAVVDGQHTLYLIVEAEDRDKIEAFVQPFRQAGTVEIWPASSCERIVERGGC